MKVMFLVFHTLVSHSGISKKILAQADALRENGAEVDLCSLVINPDGTKHRDLGGKVIRRFGGGLRAKLLKRMDYSDIVRSAAQGGYDLVYIRYDINADPFTVRMMRGLHKCGVRTVVEIPTWPYDGEFKGQGLVMNAQLAVDRLFRRRFFSYCNAVVLYNGPVTLFGKKVIHISNGVDFGTVPLSHPGKVFHHTEQAADEGEPSEGGARTGGERMKMLSVANIHLWHALDRLIRGMALHREIPCELHIVGDGIPQIIDDYRTLVREAGLEERVKILGPLYGEALDREFEWADIAVGSLGRHRSGISGIKTLKNREYAARGLSFFYSEQDSDFDNAPFVFKVPADESPVDIGALRDFLSGMSLSGEQIRESVRHLGWKEQMGIVLRECAREASFGGRL